MTSHKIVEPFSERPIPIDQQKEHGTGETGLRIPLSLGDVQEEFDKKGEPAQVYDVIWNPGTVARCLKDAAFRQSVVELAFNYIAQKYNKQLDLRFTIPRMKYKGSTVQWQRIKGKKGPKI